MKLLKNIGLGLCLGLGFFVVFGGGIYGMEQITKNFGFGWGFLFVCAWAGIVSGALQ